MGEAAVRGKVVEVRPSRVVVEVAHYIATPAEPRRFVAVQALAKGDRSELAVEMMTEMGVNEIVPWQASRSIVRWSEDARRPVPEQMAFDRTGSSQAVSSAQRAAGIGTGDHSAAYPAGGERRPCSDAP